MTHQNWSKFHLKLQKKLQNFYDGNPTNEEHHEIKKNWSPKKKNSGIIGIIFSHKS
jgi:hypothetical protein